MNVKSVRCGKDTAARFIKNLYPGTFHYVTLCTTRPPRDKDENGYHFLLPNEFLQQVIDGTMLNAQEFNGWYYGLSKNDLINSKINVLPMNNEMILQMTEENRKDYALEIVFIETLDKSRLLHILNRQTYPDCYEICRRFISDKKDYIENDEIKDLCQYRVINYYDDTFFNYLEKIANDCFAGD